MCRQSSLDVEESGGSPISLDVVRSQGLLGKVTVDVMTRSGTATFLSSSTNFVVSDFQAVPAHRISCWHAVTTATGETFVLMLTSLYATEQLKSYLPASSPVEVGQSVLFRWQGALVYMKVRGLVFLRIVSSHCILYLTSLKNTYSEN